MSEEQLKAFLEKVKGDTTLQEQLKATAHANNWAELTNAVVAIAKEAGFSISTDDINQTQSELSEDELEGVTGGGRICMASVLMISTNYKCIYHK